MEFISHRLNKKEELLELEKQYLENEEKSV
jgi:hypothetical protein